MKQRLVFAMLMGVLTTSIISFVLILLNLGFGPAFLGTWLRSWGLAYLVAIPIIVFVGPRVQAGVDRWVSAPSPGDGRGLAMRRKLAFALSMGVFTTGIISFTLISVNVGFVASFKSIWLRSWGVAYLAVIPAILFVAPRVQGRVDRMFARADEPQGAAK